MNMELVARIDQIFDYERKYPFHLANVGERLGRALRVKCM